MMSIIFTKSNYNQHRRGQLGPGYKARCGKMCKWPSECKKHQIECDDCRCILLECNSKPKNPRIKKFRKWFPKDESSSESEKENESDSENEEDVKTEKNDENQNIQSDNAVSDKEA